MALPIDAKETAPRPDIYIGLVCAAGTDLTEVRDQFQAQLSVVGYNVAIIKVSALISQVLELPSFDDEHARISALMLGGDCIRESSDGGHGVAAAIVAEIRRLRAGSEVPSSTAYIIDSLKNPAELALLDKVYGRNYYTVSVFKPQIDRQESLKNLIAKDRHEPPDDTHDDLAKELIKEDEKGSGKKSQNVQSTFPRADFFINGLDDISDQTWRFVEIVFEQPFKTPTFDEYAMFMARGTALRSCDLSRQVGVVIADRYSVIIATGCNEVPYPGGGFYLPERGGQIGDNRDFKAGHDPNYLEIQRTLIELIRLLQSFGHITADKEPSSIVHGLLHGEYKELMSNARIRNLIEFGRVVHAEMHAISQAAADGRSLRDSILYSTTFPCHGCARHIISAGISEVVFIEPYPKSLTFHLYGKEIDMINDRDRGEESAADTIGTVKFRPFYGVAPALYMRAFAAHDRKDQYGTIASWKPKSATPVGAIFGVERPKVEIAAAVSLANAAKKARVLYDQKSASKSDGAKDHPRPADSRPGFFSQIFQRRPN